MTSLMRSLQHTGVWDGKVAIVTGSASGIGRALGEALGERGARVVVADIDAAGARAVADAIVERGGRAEAASVDVSKCESVRGVVKRTVATHGRLDYMFNNAGIAVVGEADNMTRDHWRRILDVNLWGVIDGTMAAYEVMLHQGAGHIVNTASLAGLIPTPMLTAYSTTKHAVVGLSLSLRAEAEKRGVRVSVVCPGIIRTPIPDAADYAGVDSAPLLAAVGDIRMMEPDVCARVVLKGVARNRPIITVTAFARLAWWLWRLHPGWVLLCARKPVREFRAIAAGERAKRA